MYRRIYFAAWLAGAACSCTADVNNKGTSPTMAIAADALDQVYAGGGFPGIALAVGVDGEIVYSDARGFADIEQSIGAKSSTRFFTYSTAKVVTGLAAAKMIETDRLDLNALVIDYIPGFAEPYGSATVREVVGHLSGITNYDGPDEWLAISATHCDRPIEARQFFENDAPGPIGEFNYTTFNYALLASMIEAATGSSYVNVVNDLVFAPAGVERRDLHSAGSKEAGLATPYWNSDYTDPSSPLEPAPDFDQTCRSGGGGWALSAKDLASIGEAFVNDRILSPGGRDLVAHPIAKHIASTEDGIPIDYGFGVFVLERPAADGTSTRVVYHTGGAPGGRAMLMADIDRGIVVAFAANAEGPSLESVALDLIRKIDSAN